MERKNFQRAVDQLVPRSVKDIQKFLRLANYYRQFVKNFARVAKPLYEMTKKDVKWNWRERQQRVFKKLKKRFTIELVLVILDLDKEIRVEANISDLAIEGILSMKYEDKEMLAIIRCLEAQRHFLKETKDQFKIWTDYKNLEYFMKAQKLN